MQSYPRQLAKLLVKECDGKSSDECQEIVKAFVGLLAERQLLGSWRQIEHALHNAWKDRYGASNVEVTSAHPVSDELKKQIESMSPGADRTYRVSEEVIGGLRLRIDDTLIDGTISGKLNKLKAALA